MVGTIFLCTSKECIGDAIIGNIIFLLHRVSVRVRVSNSIFIIPYCFM